MVETKIDYEPKDAVSDYIMTYNSAHHCLKGIRYYSTLVTYSVEIKYLSTQKLHKGREWLSTQSIATLKESRMQNNHIL